MVDGPILDFAAIVHGLRLAVFVFTRIGSSIRTKRRKRCARACRRNIRPT